LAVRLVPDLLKLAGVVTLSTLAAQMDATMVDATPRRCWKIRPAHVRSSQ
jgi:hypothetical protein